MKSTRKKALLVAMTILTLGVLPASGCVADQVLQTISLAFRIAGVWT